MKAVRWEEIPSEPVGVNGADGVRMRIAVGPADGADHFIMRIFDVAPGGHTPLHEHASEHGIYVLEGRGVLVGSDGERPVGSGTVACVSPSEIHQFRNAGDTPLRFICVIPAGS